MALYCNVCDLSFRDNSDFIKHNNTKRHLSKIRKPKIKKPKNTKPKDDERDSPLYIKYKDLNADSPEIKFLLNEIKKLKKESKNHRKASDDQINALNMKVIELEGNSKHPINNITNIHNYGDNLNVTNHFNDTINIDYYYSFTYEIYACREATAMYHYPPPLRELNNYEKALGITDKLKFVNEIVELYKHQALPLYFAQVLTNAYTKKNPKNQSIWSSPLTRKSFIICDPDMIHESFSSDRDDYVCSDGDNDYYEHYGPRFVDKNYSKIRDYMHDNKYDYCEPQDYDTKWSHDIDGIGTTKIMIRPLMYVVKYILLDHNHKRIPVDANFEATSKECRSILHDIDCNRKLERGTLRRLKFEMRYFDPSKVYGIEENYD